MKTSLVCLCVLLSCIFVAGNVQNSFFPGRSGDILIASSENKADASMYIHNVATPYNGKDILDFYVADLLSHLLGITPLSSSTDRSTFPQIDLFKRPKANLLIAVDATEAGFETLAQGKKIQITATSVVKDSIAALTTISTGATPSAHGIVGRSWLNSAGLREQAYVDAGQPALVGFADILSQTFKGTPLTVSISADYQMAAALAAHVSTFRNKPTSNNFAYFWNQRTASVDSLSFFGRLEREFALTQTEIVALLPKIFEEVSVKEQLVTVKIGSSPVTFNLADKEDSLFFTELAMIVNFANNMKANSFFASLTADKFPDFFAVSISTLKGIKAKSTPAHYAAAVKLVESALALFIRSFEESYGKEVAIEVVFLGSFASPLSSEIISTTNIVLEHDLITEKVQEEYLPSLHLKSYLPISQRSIDCAALRRSLVDFPVQVYCPENHQLARGLMDEDYSYDYSYGGSDSGSDSAPASGSGSGSNSSSASASASGSGSNSSSDSGSGSGSFPVNNNNSTVALTADELTAFQVIFLMFFVLISAVIAAIIAVCTISTGSDTILVTPAKK